MRLHITFIIAALLFGSPAMAQTLSEADQHTLLKGHLSYSGREAFLDRVAPHDPALTYIQPTYALLPGSQRMADYYPAGAVENHIDGISVLDCGWDDNGFARDCRVVAEAPAGYGFGQAMLAAMEGHIRIDLKKVTVPVDKGRFHLTYLWTLR